MLQHEMWKKKYLHTYWTGFICNRDTADFIFLKVIWWLIDPFIYLFIWGGGGKQPDSKMEVVIMDFPSSWNDKNF